MTGQGVWLIGGRATLGLAVAQRPTARVVAAVCSIAAAVAPSVVVAESTQAGSNAAAAVPWGRRRNLRSHVCQAQQRNTNRADLEHAKQRRQSVMGTYQGFSAAVDGDASASFCHGLTARDTGKHRPEGAQFYRAPGDLFRHSEHPLGGLGRIGNLASPAVLLGIPSQTEFVKCYFTQNSRPA